MRAEHPVSHLSGGEQQRVAVARALINNPSIVFADEPTGNLDSTNAKELHHLFVELRDRFDQTFLIVTHNEELAGMSDRVLVMSAGRIAAHFDGAEVTAEGAGAAMLDGRRDRPSSGASRHLPRNG